MRECWGSVDASQTAPASLADSTSREEWGGGVEQASWQQQIGAGRQVGRSKRQAGKTAAAAQDNQAGRPQQAASRQAGSSSTGQ